MTQRSAQSAHVLPARKDETAAVVVKGGESEKRGEVRKTPWKRGRGEDVIDLPFGSFRYFENHFCIYTFWQKQPIPFFKPPLWTLSIRRYAEHA